ncbi:hypothetical protein [Nocardioides sp.]|uniref:hypothetical protein n=1 Tax=Nocardioides sp. TaxID=35761 RepID=UPI00351726AE
MSLSRRLARPLVAAGIGYLALGALRDPAPLAPKAARVTDAVVPRLRGLGLPLPQDTAALVRLNAAAQIGGAALLGTGRAPRLGAAVLAGSLVPTTIAGHAFWAESDPVARKLHTMQFAKNTALTGALVIAAGDTDGRPGVAWRARRATRDARREAKHLARSARREAKLARATLT